MSSDSEESPASAHPNATEEADTTSSGPNTRTDGTHAKHRKSRHEDEVEEEEFESIGSGANGMTFATRRRTRTEQESEESASETPRQLQALRPQSPDSTSTPDDTPSIPGSGLSSPGSSLPASHLSLRPHRPTPLQPFERRFSARLSPSSTASPRVASPAFLASHSRQSSISSILFTQHQQPDESDTAQPPWDVVRWTRLKKITGQVFSEVGKRNFGRPTCLAVAASLVVGTSKGVILVFDYQQVLKSIIGPGTKAIECGPVTALAISADHSTVAGGHATGHIFTWELARPAKPFLHIIPLERKTLDDRKSDGHVSGVAILHIGFLGTRHTALVSADDGGMAFSHLATRGLGALARTVKIMRVLGRYPLSEKSLEKPRKPSSVLAFSPLPLGNVEQPTDDMGLTALLTPYLLVIVSTTPIAQTQHKASRPKEIAPHSALSGCLAWFPAVKLKNPSGDPAKAVSKTKLVYCWSNVLTILDVDCIVAAPTEREKPTELKFRPRSRWRSEEAIVAVQWLSRSVLGVLTISQRLLILEDNTLRTTDTFDLLQKHIYHSDLFSHQLKSVIEQHDESDGSMHGVVADAFYMSFRAYKGRLFLLGFNDVSIGTLSNWADRLMALMEDGDFIAAIRLATSYYVGDADKLTVGLPEDDNARHALVQEKLLEMITASLKYTFSRENEEVEYDRENELKALAEVCFAGLMSMKELEFLFEDVYDAFEEASAEKVFFETLEPYIVDEEIHAVPPNVLKDLITFYASADRGSRLEEMICRLSTDTIDLNQVTMLCQQYNLYDALIYVWTRAMGDFITPLVSILSLVKVIDFDVDETENIYLTSAKKIFPYLAYTWTGRAYPEGTLMDDGQAYSAKKDMYRFMFSGKTLAWPPGSGEMVLTRTDKGPEPSFPYLQLVLEFDASSFMSVLNEAFEDSFLNGETEATNGNQVHGARGSALTPTRQYIINILLGLMTTENFDVDDVIYFYMFVARNLPKYPQHIMLPGTSLQQMLVGLCSYPMEVVKEDCQLSVEYLLSVYHPPNLQSLVPLFEKVGFHRVLKSVYRGSQQWARLLDTYFDDAQDEEAVFGCISDCLRPSKGLIAKQVAEVKAVIVRRARELVNIDAVRAAQTLKRYAPDLSHSVLDALDGDSDAQYHYLKALIEPEEYTSGGAEVIGDDLPSGFTERYVQLMCRYDSGHVADFVSLLKSGDLRLDPVLPALEQSGVIDAAVVLMARDGLIREAMDRLVRHLETLETALTGLINAASETPDVANTQEAIQHLLDDIQKYVKVGIWLCQGQTRSMERPPETLLSRRKSAYGEVREQDLALDELIWLEMVDAVVRLTKNVSNAASDLQPTDDGPALHTQVLPIDTTKLTTTLRTAVQTTFSALLASTTVPPKPAPASTSASQSSSTSTRPSLSHRASQPATNPSFLRILRTFLTRATTTAPSLAHLRAVLTEIFAAYTFEETILSLANRFLDKEGFVGVKEVYERRLQGWRPKGQVCEGCRGRVWGLGTGLGVWEAWETKEKERTMKKSGEFGEPEGKGKGKGKRESVEVADGAKDSRALVVFACRHVWHRACLVKASLGGSGEEGEGSSTADGEGGKSKGDVEMSGRFKCPICL